MNQSKQTKRSRNRLNDNEYFERIKTKKGLRLTNISQLEKISLLRGRGCGYRPFVNMACLAALIVGRYGNSSDFIRLVKISMN